MHHITTTSFLQALGLSAAAIGLPGSARSQQQPIQGFEKTATDPNASKGWKAISIDASASA